MPYGSREGPIIKNKVITGLLIAAMIMGLSLLLYPTVSDYWNKFHASKAVASYTDVVHNMDGAADAEIWEKADTYNQEKLARRTHQFKLTEEEKEQYQDLLNIGNTGIMGYIEIPSISVSIPIYHGTEADVLQIAVGHLEWTSLPVGGEGTHCVLSGHRGLPSAKLFTDLDKMAEGDLFKLQILNKTLTYCVDKIQIVEPTQTADLMVQEGEDLCTLMTCTPYGINSHRLLVRGRRVDNRPDEIRITADAIQIDPLLVAPFLAFPLLLVLILGVMTGPKMSASAVSNKLSKKNKKQNAQEREADGKEE